MAKGQTVRSVCGVITDGYPRAGYSRSMGNHALVQSSNTKFFEQGELVESSSSCCCWIWEIIWLLRFYHLTSDCKAYLLECKRGFFHNSSKDKGGVHMEFAKELITLRKSRELIQERFAEILSVSRRSVSKWENGRAIPDVEKIVELSQIFDVTTDYLLKPSEIDELSAKTELLEQQQKNMLLREKSVLIFLKPWCILWLSIWYFLRFVLSDITILKFEILRLFLRNFW